MATLAALKTRIILDTNRDDMGAGGELEQALTDAIADAIELHADTLFWFNRASATAATAAGTATVALPAGLRIALSVTYLGAPLLKVPLAAIEAAADAAAPAAGPPARWAEESGAIRLDPVPDAAYALGVHGIAELGVPALANAWTEEGVRLILAEAKKILFRGPLRDTEGLALAADEAREALARLRRETARRAAAPLAAGLPGAAGFDIRMG